MAPEKSWFERLWSEERRQGERRASLPLDAYYWDGASPEPRRVRDISPEGMYLLTEQRWYPNTLITMTLMRRDKAEGDADRSIKLTARVVRSGTDGVGLAFVLPRSKRPRNGPSSFNYEADSKDLIQFLARLQAETGHIVLRFVSLVYAILPRSVTEAMVVRGLKDLVAARSIRLRADIISSKLGRKIRDIQLSGESFGSILADIGVEPQVT